MSGGSTVSDEVKKSFLFILTSGSLFAQTWNGTSSSSTPNTGTDVIKTFFYSPLTKRPNKLERL
jgi:hypothetical protein